MRYAHDPWARVSEHPPPDTSPWPVDEDPIECWLDAITDPDVIAGHQIYIRSAWEGAKAFRDSDRDPAYAQLITNEITKSSRERIAADITFHQHLRSSESDT